MAGKAAVRFNGILKIFLARKTHASNSNKTPFKDRSNGNQKTNTSPKPSVRVNCLCMGARKLNESLPLFMGSRQAKGEPVGGPAREKKKSQRINPAYAFPCLCMGTRKGGRFTNRPYDKTPSISL